MTGLPPRQARGVAALMAAKTVEGAAKLAQVNSRTMRRWMRQADFKAAVEAERRTMFSKAIDVLRVAASEAVAALRDVLADPECAQAVKVQAASAILTHCFRGVELVDVLERLNKLEEAAEDAKNSH